MIPSNQKFVTISGNVSTPELGSSLNNAKSQIYTMADIAASVGGGLGGTQYVFVTADGTDTENATELQAAYDTAKTMSPSATNRITVVVAPGNYNFGSSAFVLDTQYIDIVSLDGNRSVVLNSSNAGGTISVTANDVYIKGVDVGSKNFLISNNLNLLKVENCKGGDYSFGGDPTSGSGPLTVSGTFTNCSGGDFSFAGWGTASGTFVDCVGTNYSFGTLGTASGVFTNCTGGSESFAAGGTASGTFNSCVAGSFSFGDTASGVFNNCIGGSLSFGFTTLTGSLYYCRLTANTFQTVSGAGVTRLCIDGTNTENNQP